ncbi:hypothetical protein [Bartonella koehlerae]|nr:hypothetical protein [Bartonella koehlerae]
MNENLLPSLINPIMALRTMVVLMLDTPSTVAGESGILDKT